MNDYVFYFYCLNIFIFIFNFNFVCFLNDYWTISLDSNFFNPVCLLRIYIYIYVHCTMYIHRLYSSIYIILIVVGIRYNSASALSSYCEKWEKIYRYYNIIINNNKQRSTVFINVKFNSIPTHRRHTTALCAGVRVTLSVYDYVKSGCKVCRCENFCHANTRDDVAAESEIKSSPHLVIILYSAQKMRFWWKFYKLLGRSFTWHLTKLKSFAGQLQLCVYGCNFDK